MTKQFKWSKTEIDSRVISFSNDELLQQTIEAAAGDSYDGCFTDYGSYEFAALKTELERRLKEIGFLTA